MIQLPYRISLAAGVTVGGAVVGTRLWSPAVAGQGVFTQ
jgi:hypothetical protein